MSELNPTVHNALWVVLSNPGFMLAVAVVFSLGLLIGWVATLLFTTRKVATLEAMLEYEVRTSEERVNAMQESFAALSAQALRQNNEGFIQLANQVFRQNQSEAQTGFKQQEKAVASLVQPIASALDKAKQSLEQLEQRQSLRQGELSGQIKTMARSNQYLQQETRQLADALKRPEVRGRWGEVSLKRLVELAGMTEHVDFTQQVSVKTEDAILRPDMLINLPANRQLVVDVKTPLDAFLKAVEAEDDAQRNSQLKRHAQQLKTHVNALASKNYQAQFSQSPDFIVLFVPGDAFLNAALETDTDLLEYALSKQVVLASPSSFLALLRVIEYGWQQKTLDAETQELRAAAHEFDARLTRFAGHLTELGDQLSRSVDTYNRATGSYQSRVMPMARRFNKFNASQNEAKSPEAITTQVVAKGDSGTIEAAAKPKGV